MASPVIGALAAGAGRNSTGDTSVYSNATLRADSMAPTGGFRLADQAFSTYPEVWDQVKNDCFTVGQLPYPDDDQRLAQVMCFSQLLNVSDSPSVYRFANFTGSYQGLGCILANTTYRDRFRFPGIYHYCTVPEKGSDAFLFASLGLLAACFLFGKLSTVWVLITGCLLATLNYFVNLMQIGNSIALWLDIQPPDLFLYAFLPPLIVEQAIRIDFYLFKKNFVMSLMLAVVMVILTTIILIPIILFVLGFNGDGWTWVFAGLFSAVIAPTDALAVAAVLKKSNGPAVLTNLMESESLLNDATGITLFQIFFNIILDADIPSNAPSVWSVVPTIIKDIVVLSAIGFGVGLGFSIVAFYTLKWLRWRGAGNYIEATFILAMSYLVYWVTQSPCGGSGVIAVVTFGLFGNATLQWGMTGSAFKSRDFEAMWDLISFLANGLVFFWAGIASVSFLIPATIEVPKSGLTYASIVIIYLFMLIIRTVCVALFNPVFHLMKCPLSAAEILFVGWCGLRGAVSLILLATISSGTREKFSRFAAFDELSGENRSGVTNVTSDIALWTTTFIILTLVVNGPLIAPLMKSFGLTKISRAASKVQSRAKEKILEHTATCISKYQDDESVAFLTGADWLIVSKYVDLEPALRKFGRVKARKTPSQRSKGEYVDQSSYLSLLKAFCVTYWRWLKSLVLEVALLLRFRCGERDWIDTTSIYESESIYEDDAHDGRDDGDGGQDGEGGGNGSGPLGNVAGPKQMTNDDMSSSSDDGSSYDDGGFENECHFQTIERTLTRQISMATVDLERGISTGLNFVPSPVGIDGKRRSIDSPKSNEDSYHASATEDMNQVCLSGIAGQMLLKELKASQTSQDAEFVSQDVDLSGLDAGTPRSLQYYSSLPATAAAELYDDLKQNLERTRSTMATPVALGDFHEDGHVPKPQATVPKNPRNLSVATARKADTTRPTIRDLSEIFSGVSESEPLSPVSPVSPRAPVSLKDTVETGSMAATKQDMASTLETGPLSSIEMSDTDSLALRSLSRPRNLNYSYTVSGASAKQLQEELQKAEEIRRIYRPSMSGRKRDLLGNKQAFTPAEAHFGRDFNISKDGGDISRHLAKRSNLHQLKQEALATSSSGKLDVSRRASTAMSKLSDNVAGNVIPEDFPKTFSDLTCDPEKGGDDRDEELDDMLKEEHEENLDEIRSRMIAGLKQRFTKRRAEGKISLEAFQILDQTCQEQIEARGKLQLWSALEHKAQGGLFIKMSYKAAFAAGKWYKQRKPWLQKLLHYPWEGSMTLFRKNVGRMVLIGCEVAIEYTLALAVSQHVRWLKLHDEYFSTLLDEVNEEAERSHAFIIDREIEAPDTFRAIQSYRAAVIVLKDIQAYVDNLMEVGIVSLSESEKISELIDDKLRKLELTGPVWRPAKFSDIMKSLRPFIGLDTQTLNWIWNMGLFQEYMPGQAFFQEETPDADACSSNTGIFHVLSGVAKKLVYSKDDGTLLKEEYLGVGSCFGVRRALGLATGRRATVVYATGNALGRGTVVFRLMQSDVERILALSKSGSPIMHEIITRWTKVAALNVLEGSEDTLAAQLETVLSRNAARGVAHVGHGGNDRSIHTSISTPGFHHERAISLSDVLTSETFDIDRPNASPIPQKVIRARASSMAREITARLRRGFLSSEVKHLLRGDAVRQTTTIVLLKGAVEMHDGQGIPVEAPAILPHLTEEEEESLTSSFNESAEVVRRKGKDQTVDATAVWNVSSLTALILIFPE